MHRITIVELSYELTLALYHGKHPPPPLPLPTLAPKIASCTHSYHISKGVNTCDELCCLCLYRCSVDILQNNSMPRSIVCVKRSDFTGSHSGKHLKCGYLHQFFFRLLTSNVYTRNSFGLQNTSCKSNVSLYYTIKIQMIPQALLPAVYL